MRYRLALKNSAYPQLIAAFPQIGEWSGYTVIELSDETLDQFRAVVRDACGRAYYQVELYGEDRRGHLLTPDAVTEIAVKQSVPFEKEEFERMFAKAVKKYRRNREKSERILAACAADEKTGSFSLLSYKPGRFVSKERSLWFPFRFRQAKAPGQPFLVWFHGGDSAGADNLRPLWSYLHGAYPELFPRRRRKALLKSDLNVLIPQLARYDDYSDRDYVSAVKDLTARLVAETGADPGRIYCMGGSRGGCCTWLSAWLFPEFYACAIPMMGELFDPSLPSPLTPEALSHMKDLPIWVSHSEDDAVVRIHRDDETVAILRALGAPVKYTRVNGKGHHYLVPYFLENEPWAEWMFSQRKQTKEL